MRLNYALLFLFSLSAYIFPQGEPDIILSEVMFYPASGNNEFIELYNQSETEYINLASFTLKYYTSNPDSIKDAGYGTVLPPRSYAVIFEGDYSLDSGIYKNLIPSEALILKIKDNSFGTNGMANTTSRVLYLIRSPGDSSQVYTYSANNQLSFSDEKILLSGDNTSGNWGNSLHLNGTPGYKNSISPKMLDVEANLLTVTPSLILSGGTATVNMKVVNRGFNILAAYNVQLFSDANKDSVPVQQEMIFEDDFANLPPGDSLILVFEIENLQPGTYYLILKVSTIEDEDSTNNIRFSSFTVQEPYNEYNDLVINEIMYAPVSPMPEWIELFNRTGHTINLKKFTISDNNSTAYLSGKDVLLPSEEFAVISKDSSLLNSFPVITYFYTANFPALNNTGDALVIKDSLGVVLDSLYYSPSWGGAAGGVSLERISVNSASQDSSNWGSSRSPLKATPGGKNSVVPLIIDLSLERFFPASKYSVAGEGNALFIIVKNRGIANVYAYQVRFYHDANRDSIPQPQEILTSLSGSYLASGDSAEYDFQIPAINPGENIFIGVIDCAGDENPASNKAFANIRGVPVNEIRGDLAINEIMYTPVSPEPEWIEIVNRSQKVISLKNYCVSDLKDTNLVIANNLSLNPGEFLVIARDSNIYLKYNLTSKTTIGNLPQLNNDGDRLLLLDSLYRIIDSLEFKSTWGGNSGKSLEKKEIDFPSADSSSWGTSTSPTGATPGSSNSLSQKPVDVRIISAWSTPLNPVMGDNVTISIRTKNRGTSSTEFYLELFTVVNDTISGMKLETSNPITLLPDDSTDHTFLFQILNINTTKKFIIKAIVPDDGNLLDNYINLSISPGVLSGTILINEIMFNPQGGEPEWIELFNRSQDTLNLKGWSVSDVYTSPTRITLTEDIKIYPHSLIVLSRDSSISDYHSSIPGGFSVVKIPPLNNDKDGVVIYDISGRVIDSLVYYPDWTVPPGKSLERIDIQELSNIKTNWSSSLDIENSTPGRKNSVTPKENDLSVTLLSSIPSTPLYGESVRLSAIVKNIGKNPASSFRLLFEYDSDSNNVADALLEDIYNLSLISGDSVQITTSNSLPPIYKDVLTSVTVFWSEDENEFNNKLFKVITPGYKEKIIVINELMYNPDSGGQEWVELFNPTGDTVNLKNWKISDFISPSSGVITTSDYLFFPSGYVVISKDSSILSTHPELSGRFFLASLGSLGNSEDGVFVYDSRNTIIDSMIYQSSWGGIKGYSIERLSADGFSNDSSNWVQAAGGYKHTIGKPNSFNYVKSYPHNSLVINEIMYEASVSSSEYLEFYNPGMDTVELGGWYILDEKGEKYNLSDSVFVLPPKEYYLLIADSILFNKFPNLSTYPNKRTAGKSDLGLVNTGELILLKDALGNTIDSLVYSNKWHNQSINFTQDRSLEKINPVINSNDRGNWSTSVNLNGGTPGQINSIITTNSNISSKLSIAPNPFSPDNDGWEDFSVFNYNLSRNVSQITVRIFDDRGREVRTLVNNQISGSSGSVVFDGRDNNGNALRIGIYLILLEARDDNNNVFERLKDVVVVARKL